jgi:hypothetical protein
MRSMFIADGYRRERCFICSGTGKSTYRDNPEYIRFQRTARAREIILRSAPKGLDERQLAAFVREQEQSA